MFGLVLLWLLVGLAVGLLALGARLGTAALGTRIWLLPGISIVAACIGGALGSALLGRLYGAPSAGVFAVLGITVGTWLLSHWLRKISA